MNRRRKIALAGFMVAVVAVAGWIWWVPFRRQLLSYDNLTSTRIVDRRGRPLREAFGGRDGRARLVGLNQVSPKMVQATVQAEDRRFWRHHGIDPAAIGRAAWQDVSHLEIVSGASTITQQVVKMVTAGNKSRTVLTKAEEAIWAIRLDKLVRKRTILAQYLNRAPYGNQLFGVSAAAHMYFDKPADQLTLAESAMLAGIPRAPSLNNPYADFERAKDVQRRVLDLMAKRGAIDHAAHQRALDETLVIAERRGRVLAPHFTDHVLARVRPDIDHPRTIKTTLDLDLQRQVDGIINTELPHLAAKNVHQAAAVVLDTHTSQVLAWVGSRNYWGDHGGANDGVLARRQPGSALKPFVYGLYLDGDATAATMLPDIPQQFRAQKGVYIPENYDQLYHGPVSVRDALASSLNIPAVVVAERVGAADIRDKLRQLGFETLDAPADHYGLGIALGNGEVRLVDLAGAYATLGRLGKLKDVRLLDHPGRQPPSSTPLPGGPRGDAGTQAFDPTSAYILLDILSDDAARSRGFGRYSPLYFPYKVAAKTGTSAGFRDNWAVGVTPEYTVAVWAGNFDASPMNHSSGITGAAPIMRQIVQTLYPTAANAADVPWYTPPAGIEQHAVCTLSGQRPGPGCPSTRLEQFDAADVPDTPCRIHQARRVDRRNGLLAGPGCPARFVQRRVFADVDRRWTPWAIERGEALPPTRYSPRCPAGGRPGESHTPAAGSAADRPSLDSASLDSASLEIAQPRDGDQFFIDPTVPADQQRVGLRARVPHTRRDQRLTWFVDGASIGEVSAPFDAFWTLDTGRHTIGVGRGHVEASVAITVH